MSEDNSHAGQGAVMLDIGGTIGALVVTMPAAMVGTEIEARALHRRHHHHHAEDDTAHAHPHHVHAAVLNRPGDGYRGEPVASLVLGELDEGDYQLHVLPDGPAQLTVTVVGGAVTQASWPDQPSGKDA